MNVPAADLRVRVSARTEVGPIAVLDLVASGGDGLPGWAPGAHVEVLLAGGLVRQYSLCGTEPGHWRIAVLEAGGRRLGGCVERSRRWGDRARELRRANPRRISYRGFTPFLKSSQV